MPYLKKVKIKGKEYYYLFHTIRKDTKFLKKSKYLGTTIPENIEEIKQDFIENIRAEQPKSELNKLVESLHPLERKILPLLKDDITLKGIIKESNLKEVEAMRALQWLENKDIIKLKKELKEIINLDKNGQLYLKKGLPEITFLKSLPASLDDLRNKLSKDEISACIGILKKKDAIKLGKDIEITENGKRLLKENKREEFLKKLPLNLDSLNEETKNIFEELKLRKEIIKVDLVKDRIVTLTSLGLKIKNIKLKEKLIETLTTDMLVNSSWKGKTFRRYDIKVNVPKIYPGKRQPYNQFLNEIKEKLLALGFKEMTGPIIELEFWNFDALFQPQNHPARTWSATYRLKYPKYGSLPDKKIVEAVKSAHENGANTGSTGWQYKWNEKIASQLMPRAHDTAISPKYLAKGVPEGKYFSLVRCYRPDVIDATHAVEFNQLGGFVIGKDLNFTHLLGLLKQFVVEITGFKEIKFFPDYFPFTEPSVQISAKHPKLGWMELAGAGIFRPEMTEPLGYKEQIIAWGFGVDRLAMLRLGIKDIRELFSQNLDYLRNSKLIKCQQ